MKSFQLFTEEKDSKATAGYQNNPHKGQMCQHCTMWRPPDQCSAVKGVISSHGWCTYYKRSKAA